MASRHTKRDGHAEPRTALWVLIGWAAACGAWLAALGHAQTIRIPDLRQEPVDVVQIRPGVPCVGCGRVISLQERQVSGDPNPASGYRSPVSSSATATGQSHLVGAVILLPLGNHSTDKPFVGGVGTPEMRERFRQTIYNMTVRLDDGELRSLQRYDGYRFRVGDRVRLSGVDRVELVAE
jgi:hypothetical protein